MNIPKESNLLDARIAAWMAHHGIWLTRIALGLVFFWFGVLKFFPGLSPATDLAGRTISTMTFGADCGSDFGKNVSWPAKANLQRRRAL